MGNCFQGMLSGLFSLLTGTNGGMENPATTFTGEIEGVDYCSHSSSREGGFLFDVFLSFRGEDTRKGFTGHLYQALQDKGVCTFLGGEKLAKGERVDKLRNYIHLSNIFVPIFSKGYADSTWCLKEIVEIVKCRRVIIPVFFDVEPTHVRSQTGPFEPAFKRHMTRNESLDEVGEWRAALREAGGVSGFNPNDASGYESKLVQMIVKRVLKEFVRPTFDVARFPVGLDEQMQNIMPLLDVHAKGVRVVGIHGMGGIGKTTLVKAVYNAIFSEFEAYTFLSSIKDKDIISLQKQLLIDVFHGNDAQIYDVDQGIEQIKRRICNKKVLVVLDDIDNATQVHALACCRAHLSQGSRIIFTTRDRKVLKLAGLEEGEIYELKELSSELSLQLFSYHAFGSPKPLQVFTELSQKVLSIASGLPLALEVYGSLLFDKRTPAEWIAMLEMLESCQDRGIHERLKVSFEGLNVGEKEIFLDIACFFVGYEKENAEYMWRECGFHPRVALGVLQHRSLIKLNDENRFEMHDQIRDMGRQIVMNEDPKEPCLRSRLWENRHITEALGFPQKRSKTEGIVLRRNEYDSAMCLMTKSFKNMDRLRLLDANYTTFEGDYEDLPKKLKWLEWADCDLDTFPPDFCLRNIVVLDLSRSKITCLWSRQPRAFAKLKVLNLSDCKNLMFSPDFSCIPALEKLILDGCFQLAEIHESIGQLGNLVCLSMRRCWSIQNLPDSLCELSSLQYHDLGDCSRVSALPRRLGNLTSLRHLSVSGSDIASVPDISNMEDLVSVDLSFCKLLKDFPESLGSLINLEKISLDACVRVEGIPSSVGDLKNLRVLGLENTSIRVLPNSIGNLKNLRELNLNGTRIRELPESLGSLENMVRLLLNNCKQLEGLPCFVTWTNLQLLDIGDTAVKELPQNTGDLRNLKELWLIRSKGLQTLASSLEGLSRVQEINLDDCQRLQFVVGLPPSIIQFSACNCPSLLHISGISNCCALQTVCLVYCERLVGVPTLENSTHLEELCIRNCSRLEFVAQLPRLLRSLSVTGCTSLVMIWDVSNLKFLEDLDLSGCEMLANVPGLRNLNSLRFLNIQGCDGLEYPPQLPCSLESLRATYCPPSGIITYVSNLNCLVHLDLRRCEMHAIEGLETLQSLRSLLMGGCSRLSHIAQLPPSLTSLDAHDCGALEIISDISNLKTLRELSLNGCMKLVNIEGLEKLKCIESLGLQDCVNLSSGLLERIETESNFEALFSFEIPGNRWQCDVGTGLSFIHPNFFGGADRVLPLSIKCIDMKDEDLQEVQMHTQIMMEGHSIFQSRVKLMMLEEYGGWFYKKYCIEGQRQNGKAIVRVSFDRHFKLPGLCIARIKGYTSIYVTILSSNMTPNSIK